MRRTLYFAILFLISAHVSAQDCAINDLIVETYSCVNGEFLVDLDFNVVNPESDQFGVVGNATDYGVFNYADLPITLGPLAGDGETEWEFIVYDTEEPNCQATFELGIVTCCEIFDVVVDPGACENMETFSAVINFNTTNTGDVGFDVFDENENLLGFFSYDDLPVTVEGIPSSGTGDDVIIICDNDDLNCCTVVEFEGPDCDPTDCEIYDIVVDPDECSSGQFNIALNFLFENVSGTFTVQGNGNNYGTFEYGDLPIELGPFEGDGETIYEFVVSDSEVDGCSDFAVLEAPDCPEACGFRDVVIEPFECTSDTTYNLDLDFVPVSVGDQGFTVFAGDTNAIELGSYSYEDLFVTVENFPASGDFFDVLIICDNADTTCCDTIEFQALLCAECIIFDMTVEASECDTNDQFTATIDFQSQNVGNSGFQIGGNGMIYGTYDYEDLPITLGPLDGDNETFWEFAVFDLENPLCIQGVELGLINCVNPCEIGPLNVNVIECSGDGTYDLILDFDFANVDTLGFDVFAGDDLIGFYSYEELPLVIEDFPASGGEFDQITVCNNDDPECCSSFEIESPGCFEVCDIRDIIVAPIGCTSDSTFEALITFLYEDLESDFVEISSNGVDLGTFHIDSLPVLVDGFASTQVGTEVTICNVEADDCCETFEFQGLSCNESCDFEIALTQEECLPDGTYGLLIEWTDGLPETPESFSIYFNNEFFGDVPATDTINLQGLEGTGGNVEVTICANGDIDCCASAEYEEPECVIDSCDIRDLVWSEIECNDDGTFDATLDFIYEGLISAFVNITNNGESLGVFPVDSVPLRLEGLAANVGNAVIVVCDNDNIQCCGTLEYEAPECEVECTITDIAVDEVACQGDGTYSMFILFNTQGFQNEFVDLTINGESYGFFPADTSIFVDGLPGGGGNVVVRICENDNLECCAIFEFTAPECEGCSLSELNVDVTDCTSDSTFGAFINFEASGLDTNGVSVYADGEYLGNFPPITPVFVNGFPSGDGSILVEVCGNDEACCAEQEIEQLSCGANCPIIDVSATPTDCDTNEQFFVTIELDLLGTPDGNFLLTGNGMSYGAFNYNDLPITLGPLDGDDETDWEFLAVDLENPACSDFFNLGTIDCGPSGIFGPSAEAIQLDIRYNNGRPFFQMPASDLNMYIWSTTGQMLYSGAGEQEGTIVNVGDLTANEGLLIVSLYGEAGVFVGKVFVE